MAKQGKDLALSMLRTLPRLSLNNIRDNPGARKPVSIIFNIIFNIFKIKFYINIWIFLFWYFIFVEI